MGGRRAFQTRNDILSPCNPLVSSYCYWGLSREGHVRAAIRQRYVDYNGAYGPVINTYLIGFSGNARKPSLKVY